MKKTVFKRLLAGSIHVDRYQWRQLWRGTGIPCPADCVSGGLEHAWFHRILTVKEKLIAELGTRKQNDLQS
jgi:hypothetical protein